LLPESVITWLLLVAKQELAQLRTRTALELRSKEAEIAELKGQLAVHAAERWGAVRDT